ncbi:MAG TPA: SIMPL domain-containing protein [Candidatus Moranbacteria bacterium]|nr:SIMPL domain-containing protein [Candidatus Moranbacteria bacterium]
MESGQAGGFEAWKDPRVVLAATGILALCAVLIISILRERIVSPPQNQVGITGQGKIAYRPDTATAVFGVQVDRASSAEEALRQLNGKMTAIVAALEGSGIPREDIRTQNYSVNPQYDYADGVQRAAGYSANQQLTVKIRGIDQSQDATSRVISAASGAGANQVQGINFAVEDVAALKQQARLLAIADARAKAPEMARAAGVKLGEVASWYENVLSGPENPIPYGYGGMGGAMEAKSAQPAVPSGSDEIVIEVTLNYSVR